MATKKATKKAVAKTVAYTLNKEEQDLVNLFRKMKDAVKRENDETVEDSYDLVERITDLVGNARYM